MQGIGTSCDVMEERGQGSVSAACSIHEDRHLQVTPLSVHTDGPSTMTDNVQVAVNNLWVDI